MDVPTRPDRVLIVVTRRLGDVLLATTLIRSVRRAWPHACLEVLVNAGSAAVLDGNPDIDRLWVQPEHARVGELWRLARSLFRRYDLAISALYNDRPHLWALLASSRRAGVVPPDGHPGARWKRWLCAAWTPLTEGIHTVEQYMRLADVLGIARVPEVVPPRRTSQSPGAPGGHVVLHPMPRYRYKEWTVSGWQALARSLIARGLKVVLSGDGARDQECIQAIAAGLSPAERAHVVEVVGQPLAALTPLIETARLFVGPDTAVTHLAASTGTPTLALFGPSSPVAWGPWPADADADAADSPWRLKAPMQRRGTVWMLQGEGACVPCLGEGCERHLSSPSRCLDELSPQRVIALVDRILAEGVPGSSASDRVLRPSAWEHDRAGETPGSASSRSGSPSGSKGRTAP